MKLNSLGVIKCQVSGNPSAEISWFKGREKQPIVSSSTYEQKFDGLKISRVSSIDADLFWCQADVMETGESKEYPIEVLLARRFSIHRRPRRGGAFLFFQRKFILFESLVSRRVQWRNARRRYSVKLMECRQRNILGSTLRFVVGNDRQSRGEKILLFEQNVPIVTSGSAKHLVRGNRLLINYVDQTDQGRYVCQAVNNYDRQGQRAEYDLRVLGKEESQTERVN